MAPSLPIPCLFVFPFFFEPDAWCRWPLQQRLPCLLVCIRRDAARPSLLAATAASEIRARRCLSWGRWTSPAAAAASEMRAPPRARAEQHQPLHPTTATVLHRMAPPRLPRCAHRRGRVERLRGRLRGGTGQLQGHGSRPQRTRRPPAWPRRPVPCPAHGSSLPRAPPTRNISLLLARASRSCRPRSGRRAAAWRRGRTRPGSASPACSPR
jgi:hypothetical protein